MKHYFLLVSLMLIITFTTSGCVNRHQTRAAPPVAVSTPSQDDIEMIIEAVLLRLNDPDSAKFGLAILVDGGKGACIEVNAKNAYGGYTGYQHAMVMNVVGGWFAAGIQDVPVEKCVKIVHKVLKDQGYL